jgi:signal recognition particle subunit SRP68
MSKPKNALALINRAAEKSSSAHSYLSSSMDSSSSESPNLSVTPSEAESLHSLLQSELQRQRALVEISNLTSTVPKAGEESIYRKPLVERLHEYPADGVVDLKNIVKYPPKVEVVPVKPLFFDAAWNYVDYPGRRTAKVAENGEMEVEETKEETQQEQQEQQPQKKGWFGFGRS